MNDAVFIVPEVAALLQVDRQTVYRFVRDKKLPCLRVTPNCIRFRQSDIDAYLASETAPAGESPVKTKLSKDQREILRVLSEVGRPYQSVCIAAACGRWVDRTWKQSIAGLRRIGLIELVDNSCYVLASGSAVSQEDAAFQEDLADKNE